MIKLISSTMFVVAISVWALPALSQTLKCQIYERDQWHTVDSPVLTSAYIAYAHDYKHFRFKPVVVSQDGALSYVKIHVYYQTRNQPVLMHMTMYSAPFVFGPTLTGVQTVYSPDKGRPFTYDCHLVQE
jgi:hypothetical protein